MKDEQLKSSVCANLPQKLYKAQQVRDNEALVAKDLGIAMFTLMHDAGRACFELVRRYANLPKRMTVLCGYGNNGGDGYIVARLAKADGWQVNLLQIGESDRLQGDAAKAREQWLAAGGDISPYAGCLPGGTVIVDAMLGSGLSGAVRGVFAEAIAQVNQGDHALVLAVDIPSGLNADTGVAMGCAVVADVTCTFVGVKQGLLTGCGLDFCGQLHFAGLNIAQRFEQMVEPAVKISDYQQLLSTLGPRKPSSHKGSFGHVLLIGGNQGMSGAIRLAARAALRSGAGLVSVCTHPDNVALVAQECPEVMVGDDLERLLPKADVLVFGPGGGSDDWCRQMLDTVIKSDKPVVIDADGLNQLAQIKLSNKQRHWVLTPHPKEASRLLGCDVATVQRDRFAAVSALSQKYGAVVLLKGVGTLICQQKRINLNISGNPGMASAGMGDVLSGIIGALIAQGMNLHDSASFAALVHGMAGDRAARQGQRGMMATDLLPYIRAFINGIHG